MTVYIIPTTTAEHVAKNMVGREDFKVIFPEGNKEGKRRFPDNEVYTRIPLVDELNDKTVVLHSGGPDPNSSYVELDMLLEILSRYEALPFPQNIPLEVFFTYFAYGSQDNVFQKGETNFAGNIILKLTEYYGIERLYTIDAHFAGRRWMRDVPVKNVSTFYELEKAVRNDYSDVDILYLAPDAGSQRRTGLRGLRKRRLDSYTTEFQTDEELATAVKGQVVGVVDDMVRTGSTLIPFYDKCISYGASEVIALVTHGVLESGIKRIQDKFSRLYLTNTINREQANVDITDLVVETIKRGFS